MRGLLKNSRVLLAAMLIVMLLTLYWVLSPSSPGVISQQPTVRGKSASTPTLESVLTRLEALQASLQAVQEGKTAVASLADIGASRKEIAETLQQVRAVAGVAGGEEAPQPAALCHGGLRSLDIDPIPQGGGGLVADREYWTVNLGGWRTVGVQGDETFRVVKHDDSSPQKDWYIFWARAGFGQWEPQTLALMRELMDPTTTYIDFGTWIGPTLLYASRKAGQVWGLEADPVAYGEAARNLAANAGQVDNVHLRRACISQRTEKQVAFHSYKEPGDSMAGLLWGKDQNKEVGGTTWHVDCFTLPDFVQHAGIQLQGRKVIVKIDTEGGEALIMQTPGFLDWLRAHRVTLFLSVHIQHVESSLHKSGIYPEEGKRAIARTLAAYPHVYDDGTFRTGAVRGSETEMLAKLCGSCTYVASWEPLRPEFVQQMGQWEEQDAAELRRRQEEWDRAHPKL